MGYGEFGGTGSVSWRIEHGDGDHGVGHPNGGHGKDKKPTTEANGRFLIVVNGVTVANVDVNTSRILVIWDGHTLDDVPDARKNVRMKDPAVNGS
jgi:hypothetical protein